ncbi:MAG: hypothetical protein KGL35_30740 [Bradyrhizobium sp.]|nr:hypothetical protein [Bradyrhizobium sp.]
MRLFGCVLICLVAIASAYAELPKPTGEAIVSPDAKLELLFTRSAPIKGYPSCKPHLARWGKIS